MIHGNQNWSILIGSMWIANQEHSVGRQVHKHLQKQTVLILL